MSLNDSTLFSETLSRDQLEYEGLSEIQRYIGEIQDELDKVSKIIQRIEERLLRINELEQDSVRNMEYSSDLMEEVDLIE